MLGSAAARVALRLAPRAARAALAPGGLWSTVAITLPLFAGIYTLRWIDPPVADVPLTLLVVPIAVWAIRLGALGGLAASALSIVLTSSWYGVAEQPISALGYLFRGTSLMVVGGLVGYFADERRTLERALERHRTLTLDLIAIADFDGQLLRVNPAWTQTLGYSEPELLGHSFRELIHPDDQERTRVQSARLAAGDDIVNFRNRMRTKDGSYRWLEWKAKSLPDERKIYSVARDISERKLAEELLENHNHVLERLVSERTRALEESRLETLRRLALAAEYRDDDTYAHTERVGYTAELLALELGLSDATAALIRRAAPLHDIGKLGVSDSILLKPGKLTASEFAQMEAHTEIGAKILGGSSSDILRLAEEIVRTHHEKWDGSGYPVGLRGDTIPISGRITAVADVFDALTHTRPYKEAWPLGEAVDEISRLSGTHFDPDVVAAFERLDHASLLDATEHHQLVA